jgi:hypothetical protein
VGWRRLPADGGSLGAAILNGGLATTGDRIDVVDLEKAALGAALAILAHERALLAIAGVYGVLDLARNVPGIGVVGRAFLAGARPSGRAELVARKRRKQGIERSIEDLAEIAGWDSVAQ